MRVALAALRCRVGDVAANTDAVVATVREHADWGVDVVVTPEAFLQGFAAFTGDPAHDRDVALPIDAPALDRIRRAARQARVVVCVGFYERAGRALHSSALVVGRDGTDLGCYRRLSSGWRDPRWDPTVYLDGTAPVTFTVADKRCTVALCGDLVTDPSPFQAATPDVVLWPLHRDLPAADWPAELAQYARIANQVYAPALLVNDTSGDAVAGAAWFRNGKVRASTGFDGSEPVMVVDLR